MNKPLYLDISDQLIEKIKNGDWPTGAIVPTEAELQEEFGVSRVTIRKAMKVLVEADLLYRVRGSGTYVKAPKVQHNAFQLTGFIEEISAQGKTPSSRILTFELIESDALIAQKLQLEVGEQVYSIRRLRLIEDTPEILEHTYMPLSFFPDLSIQAMQHSKYEYIEKEKGLTIRLSRQEVHPVLLDAEIAQKLEAQVGDPVIRVDSVGELDDGRPFEFTIHYFRVKQYSFNFVSYRHAQAPAAL
ncbi:GntR family transcriptional regulator [Pseudovibrio exalbescens]|uniref:Transcriptional regulator n=1 Tax=Pseudovibrio exalbescens TaxID=197461 RepID=A0A1U7JEC2_9HYPH|nr:GntR family transcriptional regulator [Pseudovibrio exalbescens]OKL42991.1 transcriptional regulator [Pseudovibrio exalbescens]